MHRNIALFIWGLTLLLSCKNSKKEFLHDKELIRKIEECSSEMFEILSNNEKYLNKEGYIITGQKETYVDFYKKILNKEIEFRLDSVMPFTGLGDFLTPSIHGCYAKSLREIISKDSSSYEICSIIHSFLIKCIEIELLNEDFFEVEYFEELEDEYFKFESTKYAINYYILYTLNSLYESNHGRLDKEYEKNE